MLCKDCVVDNCPRRNGTADGCSRGESDYERIRLQAEIARLKDRVRELEEFVGWLTSIELCNRDMDNSDCFGGDGECERCIGKKARALLAKGKTND